MSTSGSRRLKKRITYTVIVLVLLAAAGNLVYPLLKTRSVHDLYGPYPPDAQLANLDLFPTLLALAGVGLPADRVVDGCDISGLLTGTSDTLSREAVFFYHYDLLEGVRAGKWKYFRKVNRYTWPVPIDAAPVPDRLGRKQLGNRWPLLYDLELDPRESYNVLSTYPEKGAELAAALEKWEQAAAANPRGFRQ